MAQRAMAGAGYDFNCSVNRIIPRLVFKYGMPDYADTSNSNCHTGLDIGIT